MTITSFTMQLTLAVAAACLLIRTSHAFSQSSTFMYTSTYNSRLVVTTTSTQLAAEPTKESMEQDIQDMRAQAKERLRALTEQMADFKPRHDDDDDENGKDKKESKVPATEEEKVASKNKILASAAGTYKLTATSEPPTLPSQRKSKENNLELLDDTRWKIFFNLRRERGTWMNDQWGKSGDSLRFQVTVDLTEEPSYERDDFFQGVAGAKVLEIVEAWVVPTGVGAASRGRQPIKVEPVGAYKVLPGKGPAGTDILRLYIELLEKVQSKADGDIFCPEGRVYGTCGYYSQEGNGGVILAGKPYPKDVLMEQQRMLQQRYKEIEEEQEADERLMSWDQIQNMKKLMDLRMQLGRVAEELQRAREWEPEKSQLRMSRDGKVALTKEGGVSCKVRKGLAVEYHILGKMELASIKHEDDDDDDADN
jgi:hypothetical protein